MVKELVDEDEPKAKFEFYKFFTPSLQSFFGNFYIKIFFQKIFE